ncbi:MAG: glycosyltransferase family 9 protein [Phycisphaerae bacterium]|nr:glycosyltransferase family 9 protein [Tepidisphaeraceae bacterium]
MLRRNVLIFHAGALGDFVVTWPLALALGRLHPQSRIVYVAQGGKGKLAEKALRVESADVDGGAFHHLYGDPAKLPEPSRKMIEGAHSVYSFVSTPGDNWSAAVAAINPEAKVTHLSPRPGDDDPFPGHVSEWLEQQLASSPAVRTAYQQIMKAVATRGVGYKRSPEGTVVVHPGSGSPKKNWTHFVQLVRRIVKARRHVRVLIGEAEKELLPAEDLAHFKAVAEVVEPKDFVELLTHLGVADAVVCNDSGPAHLAGIIGTPTFAIYGPASNVARWRPMGPHVHVRETADLGHLGAEEVWEWVAASL